jgi:ubiquinone/menaquinone biosynthesis C-methylase UbiE
MNRQLEPELMEDPEQVLAYAQANFEIPHNDFIQRLSSLIGDDFSGTALDLGCGSGDISRRFVHAYPTCLLHALDGSAAMLNYAKSINNAGGIEPICFIQARLPDVELPQTSYQLIFSNSLLHHLPNPQTLWQTIKRYTQPGGYIAVMDLLRPDSISDAQQLVTRYASDEPDILQRDFYHSLTGGFSH